MLLDVACLVWLMRQSWAVSQDVANVEDLILTGDYCGLLPAIQRTGFKAASMVCSNCYLLFLMISRIAF